MRLIVMGGGKVGGQIARDLDHEGHAVMVIEADPGRAAALANTTDILVLRGDGTDRRWRRRCGCADLPRRR